MKLEINAGVIGWYISNGEGVDAKYLTRKGFEGNRLNGWYKTRGEAQSVLDEYLNKNKPMSIEEQIKYAKSLIGKQIISPFSGSIGLVNGFEIGVAGSSHTAIKAIKKQGCVVHLLGSWSHQGLDMYLAVDPEKKIDVAAEPWESVKINGFQAEKTETGFKFGYAEISTETLKKAKEFIYSTQGDENTNKKVESVRIGEGNFTKHDLEQLLS